MNQKLIGKAALKLLDDAISSLERAKASSTLEDSKEHMLAVNEAIKGVIKCAQEALEEEAARRSN
jgi:hypothetical protein